MAESPRTQKKSYSNKYRSIVKGGILVTPLERRGCPRQDKAIKNSYQRHRSRGKMGKIPESRRGYIRGFARALEYIGNRRRSRIVQNIIREVY
jgi:hypothetical protein